MKIFLISVAMAGTISDAPPVASILNNVLTFLLSIIGVLGIIGVVIAGILYLSAAGDTNRMRTAKAAFVTSVIGIVIALGAMVLVTGISGFFS